mgnify:FL=1
MNIQCPNCQSFLLSRNDVNKLLPLKRFGVSEIKCKTCGETSVSTQTSRSIWFVIFMVTLICLMLTGKQVVEVTGHSSELSFVVLVVVYFFVNWLFSYIWPKVLSIELKDRSE